MGSGVLVDDSVLAGKEVWADHDVAVTDLSALSTTVCAPGAAVSIAGAHAASCNPDRNVITRSARLLRVLEGNFAKYITFQPHASSQLAFF